MEKVFEDLMKTDEGRSLVFDIIATALRYKHVVQKAHNPLVKQLGKYNAPAEQARNVLFSNLTEFEQLIHQLYTT